MIRKTSGPFNSANVPDNGPARRDGDTASAGFSHACRKHNLRCPKEHGNRADKLENYILQGDPLADEVAALFSRLPPGHGAKMLDHGLEGGIDKIPSAPAALRAFFAPIEDVAALAGLGMARSR